MMADPPKSNLQSMVVVSAESGFRYYGALSPAILEVRIHVGFADHREFSMPRYTAVALTSVDRVSPHRDSSFADPLGAFFSLCG